MFSKELFEYGTHGFGGFGRGFFRRAYYFALVNEVVKIESLPARTKVIDWLVEVLRKDNYGFKPEQFRKACETAAERGYGYSNYRPEFQMRHFYYFAECITRVESEPMREFLCHWMADFMGSYNGNFQRNRWYKYCGIADPKAPPPEPPKVKEQVFHCNAHNGEGDDGYRFDLKGAYDKRTVVRMAKNEAIKRNFRFVYIENQRGTKVYDGKVA